MLLRGVENARAEAARIAAGGVKQVEVRCLRIADRTGIAEALRSVGIVVREVSDEAQLRVMPRGPRRKLAQVAEVVEAAQDSVPAVAEPVICGEPAKPAQAEERAPDAAPPAPAHPPVLPVPPAPPSLELVSHDAQAEQAVFRYGPATYTVQVPWGTSTSAEVILTTGTQSHRDRFDLAVTAQRLRFASKAGLRNKLPPAEIATALALILPAVQRLGEPKAPEAIASAMASDVMTAAEREATMVRLRSPDLLPRLVADLGTLGAGLPSEVTEWVLLAAVSRLATEPLWLALTSADPAERFPILDVLARIIPPEAQIHCSRLTDTALFHGDPDGLRHKLLLLDDLMALSTNAATALRVLHARGRITTSQVQRDVVRGTMRTRIITADGPIAVVSACAGPLPESLRHHLAGVSVDVHGELDHGHTDLRRRLSPIASGEPSIRRLHQLQRVLHPLPVIIPEAEPLELPALITRDRTLHEACLGLITASALLHQHQRMRTDGAVVATGADIAIGVRLALDVAEARASGLSPGAHRLVQALVAAGRTTFTMEDCADLVPSATRWSFRTALTELTRLDLVVPSRTGQGKQRSYALVATRRTSQLGGLAALGGGVPPSSTREVANG
jgi:hypothetical protein